jgi:hypothetical protein
MHTDTLGGCANNSYVSGLGLETRRGTLCKGFLGFLFSFFTRERKSLSLLDLGRSRRPRCAKSLSSNNLQRQLFFFSICIPPRVWYNTRMKNSGFDLTNDKALRTRHGIGGFGCPCCNLYHVHPSKAKPKDSRYVRRKVRQNLQKALDPTC